MKQDEDKLDESFCNTQMRFFTLRNKGRLGVGKQATLNWQFATRDASNVEVEVNKFGNIHLSPSENDMNIGGLHGSLSVENDIDIR